MSEEKDLVLGVPEKDWKRLVDYRTKIVSSIVKFSFDFNRKHSNVYFETKFAQIQCDLIEIYQFHN